MDVTELMTSNTTEAAPTCKEIHDDLRPSPTEVTKDVPSPTRKHDVPQERTQTSTSTHELQIVQSTAETDTVKQRDIVADSCAPFQLCQQIEIVGEEQNCKSHLPQIDAIWSIGQEHSYEQKPWKCTVPHNFQSQTEKHDETEHENANTNPDNLQENSLQAMETQITSFSVSDDSTHAHVVHLPQIIKVQPKAKKRYIVKESNDINANPAKFTGPKAQQCTKKTYRTLKVLKLPHPSNNSKSAPSCGLINHNLKPLQIQHNLLHKDKSTLTVLELETKRHKQRHRSKSHNFSLKPFPQIFPAHTLSVGQHRKKFTVAEPGSSDNEDEVGPDAVYVDVDQAPFFEFSDNGQFLSINEAVIENPMLDSCNANLCMDQYLPDISDLPQFHNIPPDGMEDQCDEPAYLTPSIDHSVLDYSGDFLPADHFCCSYTSTPAPITKLPPVTVSTISHPAREALNHTAKFQKDTNEDMQASFGAQAAPSAKHASVSMQISAATATSATVTSPLALNIKKESQWQQAEDSETRPGTACNWPHSLTAQDSLAGAGTSHHHNPISTAVMAALDLDVQPFHSADQQNCATTNPSPSPSYLNDDSGLAIGCPSTFLSPPPSVEQMVSQRSTPCMDNESGYITMEEQEQQSSSMWPQHQHFQSSSNHCTDSGYNHNTSLYSSSDCGYGEGGSYPYTHQDSQYQTLHQTASSNPCANDIIYYPFNDLMQLNPNLISSDQDVSVPYLQPGLYQQHGGGQPSVCDSPQAKPQMQPFSQEPPLTHKRGRGGHARGPKNSQPSQIQSDHITSSLQRQLQAQIGLSAKKQPRRRNTEGRKKSSGLTPSTGSSSSGMELGEKKGRHNEPLNQNAVDIMFEWYQQHEDNPYPSKDEKERMAVEGGITTMQVKSWFANKRNRSNNTRPKVQKRAMEEKLMQIYNQLSKTEGTNVPEGGNSFIIKELSQIINNKLETEMPATPESNK